MPGTEQEIDSFIKRWKESGGHERANYQLFLGELCTLLEVPVPDPAKAENEQNAYVFERSVVRAKADGTSTTNYLDLYKSACFVLETKQGVSADQSAGSSAQTKVSTGHGKRGTAGYDKAMEKAYNQASGYIQDLPASDGRPPFLIVCDVGHVFELYAEFTRSGGRYQRFPDPKNHRIQIDELHDPEKRELLRLIWTDPMSLDPSKRIAKVTRDIAARLAELAKSLEAEGKHDSETVALFLQRCLFTMFAEDIGLLPEDGFLDLLRKTRETVKGFPVLVSGLWKEMAKGAEFSAVLMKKIAHFNGGLFDNPTALPLSGEQIDFLIAAAEADWTEVDPAIFGTLLERALDPRERHKLGAHYTPRSYVERLIEPTVIEPLRNEWESVKAAAVQLCDEGKEKKACLEVENYHHKLCQISVLDPACGSGNFLYVTLEHLKRLEAEVLDFFELIGGDRTLEMEGYKVRPEQFHGLEINPAAVNIAQLVLWIGYFQWHYRTTGKADTNDRPLLPKQNSILHQDAVLAYDEKVPRKDDEGNYVTIWDGRSTKTHPVTGKEVPDDAVRKPLFDYTNPRRPEWPQADYIVGNPPFVGNKRMRDVLGDGYTEALRKAWKKEKPNSWDFVMFWWHQAAELLKEEKIQAFGVVTTNSITQTTNRKVVERFLNSKSPMRLVFAVPDHPWVDSSDGAAVRIAMTVLDSRDADGNLQTLVEEKDADDGEYLVEFEIKKGSISADFTVGASLARAIILSSNEGVCFQGMNLVGEGFRVDEDEIQALGFDLKNIPSCIREYQKGRELVQGGESGWVIDCFGIDETRLRLDFPAVYQHLLVNVKPARDHNKRKTRREKWWLFGEVVGKLRLAIAGLERIIVTVETSKFKPFVFLNSEVIPDHKLYAIASGDGFDLGVLSSEIHQKWALNAGGRIGQGNDPTWTNTTCFKPFPFPSPDNDTQQLIRDLGEKLDAHRKRQQSLHPDLTLTGIYNVLEKLRDEEALTAKEKKIHNDGLVSVLKQIHDDLDQAVFHAYGWDDLWDRLHAMEGHAPACPRITNDSPDTGNASDEGQATQASAGKRELAPPSRDEIHEQVEAELLERLVALNHERAEEEKQGKIRWLRPEFQNPDGDRQQQGELEVAAPEKKVAAKAKAAKLKWPGELPAQVALIRQLLSEVASANNPAALSSRFGRKSVAREEQIRQILETLEALGTL